MHQQASLEASSGGDLHQKLEQWGASAPARLEWRKKELEKWVLNRFLKLTDLLQPESFPVEIIEREKPDFLLCYNGIELGIEITTICSGTEQASLTEEEKELKNRQGPNLLISVPLDLNEKITVLECAFRRILKKKSGKRKSYGVTNCILVCYLNSPLFSKRLLDDLIESFKETAKTTTHGFLEIYVYKEDSLYLL
ncbi:MAG: hypothetical protein COB08_007950 [Rhodobacteraceae bacterium]|nr:hypothetical protein [Paracoccaceae bacterium]